MPYGYTLPTSYLHVLSVYTMTCTPDWQATSADRLVIVLHRSSTSPSPTCHHRQNLPTQTTALARKAPGNWTRTSLTNTPVRHAVSLFNWGQCCFQVCRPLSDLIWTPGAGSSGLASGSLSSACIVPVMLLIITVFHPNLPRKQSTMATQCRFDSWLLS